VAIKEFSNTLKALIISSYYSWPTYFNKNLLFRGGNILFRVRQSFEKARSVRLNLYTKLLNIRLTTPSKLKGTSSDSSDISMSPHVSTDMGNQFEAMEKEVMEREPSEWEAMEQEMIRQEAAEQLVSQNTEEIDHLNQVFESTFRNPFINRDENDNISHLELGRKRKETSLPDTRPNTSSPRESASAKTIVYGTMHTAQMAMENHKARTQSIFDLYSSSESTSDPNDYRVPQKRVYVDHAAAPVEENTAGQNGGAHEVKDSRCRTFPPGSLVNTKPLTAEDWEAKYEQLREIVVARAVDTNWPGHPSYISRYCSAHEQRSYVIWSYRVGFESYAGWEAGDVLYENAFFEQQELEPDNDP
jgi:hypothetical protein